MPVTRILEDFSEFNTMAKAWDEMLGESPSNTIFLSHPYLCAWWERFGKESRFFTIVSEENGTLVAAAPLCIRKTGLFGFPIRVLEIIGTGSVPTRPMGLSDRVGIPARAGNEAALGELFQAIRRTRSEWDLLHLKGLCLAGSPLKVLLNRMSPADGLRAYLFPRYCSPYLALEGTFEDYAKTRSRNFRKQLAKHWRDLLSKGPGEIERGETLPPEEILEDVHRISLKSWKGRRGSGLFLNFEIREFFRELFRRFQEKEWLFVRFVKSRETRIAHEICFRYAGKLYSYDSCFDSDYASVSPGEILTASILEEAFAAGLREYDMLRGDEAYKLRWTKTMREEHEVVIAAPALKNALYRLHHMRLKTWVRRNKFLNNLDDRLSALYHKIVTNPRGTRSHG
jgi:CelD/BcsL family acetyltransferase involved in cellulose biosynthesis